jgi:hypothetical protein
MVWGDISPGCQSLLLRYPGHVNAEGDMKMLADALIFGRLIIQDDPR